MVLLESVMERETLTAAEQGTSKPRRICFVCTGNTCRSPMAEAVANAIIASKEQTEPCVCSRGLFAHDGDRISALAVQALEEAEIPTVKGCDYHMHVAQALRADEVGSYDLIVAMTDAHAMQLMMRFPEVAERIVVIKGSIPDPFGGDLAVYRECLSRICDGVRTLLASEELL